MKTTKKILWMALAMLMLSVGCTKKSSEKQMLSFKFEALDVEAVIDEETKTISATLPYYADITNLTPTIVLSENATVNPNSGVPMDFTNPVIYTVTAEDGSQVEYEATFNIENPFLGIWGVEKIEYYNIDYAGNPIAASLETYTYDPNDIEHGIQLVFREDKTGEIRDNSVDFIDTTLVTNFTYAYDFDIYKLFINEDDYQSFKLDIKKLSHDAFVYENEYVSSQVEKAYLKRLSETPSKTTKPVNRQQTFKAHRDLVRFLR